MKITKEATENQGVKFIISGSLSGVEKSTIRLFETVSSEIEKKPKTIILDIAEVTYIDSMSVGLLVGLLLKSKEKEVGFHLENIPGHIMKILDSTNLTKIFIDLC